MRLVRIHVVHPYSRTDTTAACKKLHFISSDRSNFHVTDSLSIADYTFSSRLLTSLSVDETLLPRLVTLSTSFKNHFLGWRYLLFDFGLNKSL